MHLSLTSPRQSEKPQLRSVIGGFALLAFLSLLAMIAFASHGSPARAASFKTGVSLFDTISSSDALAASKKIRAAGGSYDLVWLRWNEVAPAARPDNWDPANPDDPNYNWTTADQWVTGSVSGGVTPLVQVYGAPSWANRCKPAAGLTVQYAAPCNPNPADFAAFLKAAAKRYSGSTPGLPQVRFWQIQNEPNLHVFFNPQANSKGQPISPGIYRNLLKAGYAALKSVSRSNIVVSGGLAPNKPGGTPSLAPLHFTRELFCLNGKNRPKANSKACKGGVPVDIFDMHPYTSGGPTHKAVGKDNVQLGDLKRLKATLNAADRAGHTRGAYSHTPLWVTEMAWDSKGPDPGGVPMNLLKRWTSEAMFRSYQAGVRVFMWYSIRDRDPAGRPWNESDQAGLYFRGPSIDQDRAKPILQAYKFPFVSFPKGRKSVFVWGRNPQSKGGWVSIQRFRNGKWQRLKPVKASSGGVFRGTVRIPNGVNRVGVVRAVYRGQVSVPFSLKKFRDRPARPFG